MRRRRIGRRNTPAGRRLPMKRQRRIALRCPEDVGAYLFLLPGLALFLVFSVLSAAVRAALAFHILERYRQADLHRVAELHRTVRVGSVVPRRGAQRADHAGDAAQCGSAFR